MASKSIAEITTDIYNALAELKDEDRLKVVSAVQVLLGFQAGPTSQSQVKGPGAGIQGAGTGQTEREYFDAKAPVTKIEEIAVAARFREKFLNSDTHSRANLEETVKAARRNFDGKHFARDMGNAKTAGYFSKGSAKDQYVLSYEGQNFVDALPNRQTAARPKRATKRAAASKPKPAGKK